MASRVRSSSGSRAAAHWKLCNASSAPSTSRTRGRRIAMRRPPRVTRLWVWPPRNAWRCALGWPLGPHTAVRSCSMRALSTSLPVCTHRAKKAFLASLTALSSWLGIGTLIASAALMYWQSLDFVTVLAMVAPFVGLATPSIPRRGKEPPPQPFSSTIFGTTPKRLATPLARHLSQHSAPAHHAAFRRGVVLGRAVHDTAVIPDD